MAPRTEYQINNDQLIENHWPLIPERTQVLIAKSTNAREFPALPEDLKKLDMGWYKADTLNIQFPPNLKKLSLNASNIKTVPELPDTLEFLELSKCRKLEELPTALPAGLKKLYLTWCPITHLPKLPSTLRILNLHHCDKLAYTQATVSQLETLEASGCEVTWPQHFLRNRRTGVTPSESAGGQAL